MIAGRLSKAVAFVAIIALTTFGALATASAQPADITAIEKAYQDHRSRGNYSAAQIDAEQLERLVKTLRRQSCTLRCHAQQLSASCIEPRASTSRRKGSSSARWRSGSRLSVRTTPTWPRPSTAWLTCIGQGKYREAEGLYKRALAISEKALGANHPDVAWTLNNLAILYEARGESGSALAYSRKATAAVLAHRTAESTGTPQTGAVGGLVERRASYFQRHVANLAVAARKGIEPAPSLAHEAIEVAQWASQSSAAAAVQQMGTRFASGSGALASLVRESQDLAAAWRDQDKALLDALSNPEGRHDRARIDALRKQIAETEGRLNAVAARIDKEFPEYAALANPKPLTAEEVQKLLGADEALVFFLAGANESYVFALTREGFEWRTISLGEKNMAAKVAAFRRGLDVDELTKSVSMGKAQLFDLAAAHELYVALFGPVEALIKDKPQLLIVPSGPLTALPFHLLVTDKPAIAVPQMQISDMAAYRDAAWLVKRHAVTVLPSVASLKALRVFARKGQGTKPMIGFGDPVFAPDQAAAPAGQRDRDGQDRREDPRLFRLLAWRFHRPGKARRCIVSLAGLGGGVEGRRSQARRVVQRHSSRQERNRGQREALTARRLPRRVLRDARLGRG